MANPDAQDRNLPASARKLQKAREQGQVVRSRDLGHFAAIAVGGAALVAAAPAATGWLKQSLAQALRFDARALASPDLMLVRLAELAATMVWMVMPLGLLMMGVAVGVSTAAGGWNFTLKPLKPKFAFLNPIAGIGRLFSKQQAIDALKACTLALILGSIGGLYLKSHIGDFASVLGMDLPAAVGSAAATVLGGLALLVIALAAFAAVDVPLQRKLH
ncbi:MAG TPA: EscU/YscU/HrcU family type III secretion system export apparatus switch protein, partial [Ottowia sp.]|nr:EscU/YscU/HrcU family type III secretion system export apparatus switch protein [Ottowia sp.]